MTEPDTSTDAVAPSVKTHFTMPKAVTIAGRSSSITNSFVNGIIPVIPPTDADVAEALGVLGMSDGVRCAYCGDASTEWEHLRPLVVGAKPTGYISEIQNLVPACGKCNQSKGNKNWKEWALGSARLSPTTRGIADLDARVARLEHYESWRIPTRLDFAAVVGMELWQLHEGYRAEILALMKSADAHAAAIRMLIRAHVEALSAGTAAERP